MKRRDFLTLSTTAVIGALTKPAFGNLINNNQSISQAQFTFDGLMAICFGDPSRASVGLLNVPHHVPRLTITRVRGDRRSQIAVIEGSQLRGELQIGIEGGDQVGAVERYHAADMEKDTADFDWCVDMEKDLFQRQLYVREDRLVGKIHFSAGLFHARNLSENSVEFKSADGKRANFKRRMGEPGARIKLGEGQSLIIKGNGVDERLSGERFEIAVLNIPSKDDMASVDHFHHYYHSIRAEVPHYEPVEVKRVTYFPKPLVCPTLIFGRSTI